MKPSGSIRLAAVIAALVLLVAAVAGRGSRATSVASLTIDDLLDIRHPSQPAWSPDGRRLAFVWERAGVQNIWVAASDGRGLSSPQPVTSFDADLLENLFWSADGRTLFFVRRGDLWRVRPGAGETASAVWSTSELENQVAASPEGGRVAFVRGGSPEIPDWQRTTGDLWVRSLADGRETRLTEGRGLVSGPTWSPDGRYIAFSVGKVTSRSEAPSYSGSKISYHRVDHEPAEPAVVAVSGGGVRTFPPSPGWDTSPAWLDATHLVLQRVAADNRTREILVADVPSGLERVVYREVDPMFWSLGFVAADVLPSPDGRWIAFASDRSGWDHLYVVASSGGEPRQLTSGRFEVRHPAWSPDGKVIAFDRGLEEQPGVRHLAVAGVEAEEGRRPAVRDLTSGRGTNTFPTWSPEGGRLVYQHTDARTSPELFLVSAGSEAGNAVRLTRSMPDAVAKSPLVQPELVRYRAPDGKDVPAYLFVPPGLDRSRRHPAVVWIHGDGINQNYDGWHVERNYAVYYSFHQYLLQRGYVVLAPDYRGSIGYGRDWRQGVYLDVGGKDAQDAVSGADYLRTLGYVDPDRIGVWGLSYGGFFTLIALADHPRQFRCGVDVAGVADYRMWYEDPGGAWVVARMGTPPDHPAVYDKAAVIDRVRNIQRPLLILHGTADLNVPYIESVRLADALLGAGKDFEFMLYPGEFHYFQRSHVLRDAWSRVAAFFDRHLKAD